MTVTAQGGRNDCPPPKPPRIERPLSRLLFAVLGTGSWFFARMLLPCGSTLESSVFSLLSILPAAALTVLLVPAAANRWGVRGIRWSLITAATALLVPLALLLRTGAAPSNDAAGEVILTLFALLFYAAHEELVFRLFLADSLSLGGRFAVGALLSSVLFTVVHLDNPFSDPLGMANIFLAGIGLSLLRASGGGLAGTVLAHFLWNAGIGVLMGFGVSGYSFPAVVRPAVEQGAFGPEASPCLTVVLLGLVGAGAVSWRRRSVSV